MSEKSSPFFWAENSVRKKKKKKKKEKHNGSEVNLWINPEMSSVSIYKVLSIGSTSVP